MSYGVFETVRTPPGTEQVLNRLTAVTIVSIIMTIITVAFCSVVSFELKRISRPHSFRVSYSVHPLECSGLSGQAWIRADLSLSTL